MMRVPCRQSTVLAMNDPGSWLDDVKREMGSDWTRSAPHCVEGVLAPDLPCRIIAGEKKGLPVLYVAVGENCTANYWQWATVDQETLDPLPREAALRSLWRFFDLARKTARRVVLPELVA